VAKIAWPSLLRVRNESLTDLACPHVVGGGRPIPRHDCERQRYWHGRLRDTLQHFGQRLPPTEKRHCRYPLKSRWPPIPARQNTRSPANRAERRCQLRWNRRGKIKVSIRRHREDIGHPWILSDTDLASTAQSTFAGRYFTLRGLLVEARIDRSDAYWYKAATVQRVPSPLMTSSG